MRWGKAATPPCGSVWWWELSESPNSADRQANNRLEGLSSGGGRMMMEAQEAEGGECPLGWVRQVPGEAEELTWLRRQKQKRRGRRQEKKYLPHPITQEKHQLSRVMLTRVGAWGARVRGRGLAAAGADLGVPGG